MTTLKVTVAYKGTHYNGWQIQPNGRTVQGVLEKTISKALGEVIQILGASRTDAGVHALGQVFCVQYTCALPPESFKFVINRALPSDIAITHIEVVEPQFHPIVHTSSKVYHYKVHNAPLRDPFKEDFSWHVRETLDLTAMKNAAGHFLGEHDFASFCASGSKVKSTVRTIYSIEIGQTATEELTFKFHGNGFLYNMIRILVAVLIRIGQGKMPEQRAKEILEAKKQKLDSLDSASARTLPR